MVEKNKLRKEEKTFYKFSVKARMINFYNQIKLFIYNYKKRIIIVISLLIVFLTGTIILIQKNENDSKILVYESQIEEKKENKDIQVSEQEKEETYYYVDIKGYVNNPGVYSILKGKRVVDAINSAGGLKKDANTSLLNLSLEVTDQMVIVVYSNSEIANFLKTKEQKKAESNICNETIKNNACVVNNDQDVNPNLDKDKDQEEKEPEKKLININTANKEELMTLNKIGESKALAIIEYREKNGPFKTIDDLKNVSGIGDILFEDLKDFITI